MNVGKKANPKRWGVGKVASELEISEMLVHKLTAQGALPYYSYGINGKRFDPADVKAYKAKVIAGKAKYPSSRPPTWLAETAA